VTARALPDPGPFADDDGSPEPSLAARLARHRDGALGLDGVQHALLDARLLVPVVVAPDGVTLPSDGACGDGAAQLAGVTVTGRDGRRAQPAFTGLPALVAWDRTARPLPLPATAVARAVLADDGDALLLDPAGPVRVVLDGPLLQALAEGRRWLPPADDPAVVAELSAAVRDLPGVVGVVVTPGTDSDVTVTLTLGAAAPHADVVRTAKAAGDRLAASSLLRTRLGRGADVAVAFADGRRDTP